MVWDSSQEPGNAWETWSSAHVVGSGRAVCRQAWRRRGSSGFCPLRRACDHRRLTGKKENRDGGEGALSLSGNGGQLGAELTFRITEEEQDVPVPLRLPSCDSGLWGLVGPRRCSLHGSPDAEALSLVTEVEDVRFPRTFIQSPRHKKRPARLAGASGSRPHPTLATASAGHCPVSCPPGL